MKIDRPIVYRTMSERITTVLWGIAVVAFGTGVIAWLMGFDFDPELAGIIAFAALGLWILGAAVVAMVNDDDD
jgi:hypothetical protein